MNEFFTWELLVTYSGACVATGILVEFLKGLLPGLPPRLLSYLTAAAILLAAQLFTGTLTPVSYTHLQALPRSDCPCHSGAGLCPSAPQLLRADAQVC